jgi:hypothetical protein
MAVAENKVRQKINGTHQILVYADDVNLLGDNTNTTKKNTALNDASKFFQDLKLMFDC